MNRRFLVVAAFAVWAQCSAAWAQLVIPETNELGKPIIAEVSLPEGESFIVKTDAGATAIKASGTRVYLWATPGEHGASLITAKNEGGEIKINDQWPIVMYQVGDAPPVPPGPVVVVKTLAQLAGDKAKPLGTLYAALAPQVKSITSTASFKAVHAKLLADQGLTGNGAAAEIEKRLATVLVDPLDHAKLRGVLEAFVAELGSLPPPVPPVPVVEGKRRVVIIHEVGDNTSDLSQLFVKLRRQDVEQYLTEKGHLLDILDDDQKTASGQPDPTVARLKATGESLPALFILDLATGEVVHKQPLPSTPEAVMEALKTHGG